MEELHSVIWTYRTTPRIPTEESPFNLAYEMEEVISMKIDLPSIRVEYYTKPNNSKLRRADLNLLLEIRQEAQVQMAAYR